MSEPSNQNNSGSTDLPSGAENAEVKNGGNSQTFTQEQVNEMIQKRINEINAKNEEKRKSDIEAALAEHERQAKMTEEQRLDEARKKKDDEVSKREQAGGEVQLYDYFTRFSNSTCGSAVLNSVQLYDYFTRFSNR